MPLSWDRDPPGRGDGLGGSGEGWAGTPPLPLLGFRGEKYEDNLVGGSLRRVGLFYWGSNIWLNLEISLVLLEDKSVEKGFNC